MLRKKIVADSTLLKLIAAADKVEAKKNIGQRPFATLPPARIKALMAAMNDLDRKSADEVLVFELADETLKQERYGKLVPGKSDLPLEVQVQRMTGAYYFHLINYIRRELMVEQGRRELDTLADSQLPEDQQLPQ
jgi:hypothetical protein